MALYYTTLQAVKNYLERDGSDWSSLTEGQVEIAEDDIDEAVASDAVTFDTDTLRVFTVSNLSDLQAKMLAEAVAEQVLYRSIMPKQLFTVREPNRVSQEGVTIEGKKGSLSVRAEIKLSRAGLFRLATGTKAVLGDSDTYGFEPLSIHTLGFPPFDTGE